jgi:hypothetical protein
MPYERKFRIKGIKHQPDCCGCVVDYELEESSDTVTGTIQFTREEITSFEISEFIPSDAYYCV